MNMLGTNKNVLKQVQQNKLSKTRPHWAWRMLIWLTAGIVVLLGIGAVYQVVGTAVDHRTYPAPGQLVDVGGYKMHITCSGQGSPTVILDHVGATNSAQWALIQPVVAGHTRVCAYDRAGFGWSEPGPGPHNARHNAQELHTLLSNAGVEGPFVFVGHSFGGNVGRVFAADFPDDTAGLVLLDPGKIFHRPGIPADIDEQWQSEDAGFMKAAPTLARIGLLRLAAALGKMPGHGDLPSPQAKAFDALQLTNRFYDTLEAQNLAMYETSAQVLAAEAQLDHLPIIVLSPTQSDHGERERHIWTETNAGIAARSSNGVHREVAGAGHMALAVEQEYAPLTTAAILEMVTVVRGERPLSSNQS